MFTQSKRNPRRDVKIIIPTSMNETAWDQNPKSNAIHEGPYLVDDIRFYRKAIRANVRLFLPQEALHPFRNWIHCCDIVSKNICGRHYNLVNTVNREKMAQGVVDTSLRSSVNRQTPQNKRKRPTHQRSLSKTKSHLLGSELRDFFKNASREIL